MRTFSAAMLHAEVLARLKHPRPILINGKHFEARSTPVHFMMTSNHKAPSIELGRIVPDSRRPVTPPLDIPYQTSQAESSSAVTGSSEDPASGRGTVAPTVTDPNQDHPHVMISLALEDDQRLDLNAWEQWLANFPALAKHVKIQGVFQSHSTLLLLSLPVMVWDLLPDDPAYSFIAFIRSNNLLRQQSSPPRPVEQSSVVNTGGPVSQPRYPGRDLSGAARPEPDFRDSESIGGTTFVPTDENSTIAARQSQSRLRASQSTVNVRQQLDMRSAPRPGTASSQIPPNMRAGPGLSQPHSWNTGVYDLPYNLHRQQTAPPVLPGIVGNSEPLGEAITRTMILNQSRSSRRTVFTSANVPEGPALANHVVKRLEEYFQKEKEPNVAVTEFLASNLGVETEDVRLWFHHRREQERLDFNLQNLKIDDYHPEVREGARMILAGQLNNLLEIYPSKDVLVIDLRLSTDYEKSHIHDAINLRTPHSFVQVATLEMIEDTFADNHSQRNFSKWAQYRCVVFYDRMIEYPWECPVADALFEKFRMKGWSGQCFILKGHYKEFVVSFDKYISGTKMTQQAKTYVDGLRQQPVQTRVRYTVTSPGSCSRLLTGASQEDLVNKHQKYDEWLRLFESQDRATPIELVPSKRIERMQAVEQHQHELEGEFETHFPALFKKAQALRPAITPAPQYSDVFASDMSLQTRVAPAALDSNWNDAGSFDMKAPLVGHLDRGLDKMREAGGFSTPQDQSSRKGKETYTDKLGDRVARYSDDFDEIDPKGEGLKNDPAFQQAGAKQDTSSEATDDHKKKGRRPLWGRLRTSGNK